MNAPPCSHRPPCPGCPRYGESGIASRARRALEDLAREAGAALHPTVQGEPMGHRHRARLMVRGRSRSPKVGLFQQGSHRIVDVPHCRVHHPRINQAAAALKRAMREVDAPPYADGPHRGLVRALQAVVERRSQTVQAVVVTRGDDLAPARPLLDAFAREMEGALHSLWWNGNPEVTNVILGRHWERRSGPEAVRETLGGASVFFPPGAFGQSHLALADAIVAAVHGEIAAGARVVELHAGCGAIGLGLALREHAVACNEVSADALHGLALGVAALPDEARARLRPLPGPAADHLAALDDADVVVVDPPRKGLDPELLARLAERPPPRLVYVSCGLDSFLREAAVLRSSGAALRSLRPFALFPFTDHVETLAVFEANARS
ncbi:MAG: hypothetical protein ACQGVC_03560 [Myxococcota bacterium]